MTTERERAEMSAKDAEIARLKKCLAAADARCKTIQAEKVIALEAELSKQRKSTSANVTYLTSWRNRGFANFVPKTRKCIAGGRNVDGNELR